MALEQETTAGKPSLFAGIFMDKIQSPRKFHNRMAAKINNYNPFYSRSSL